MSLPWFIHSPKTIERFKHVPSKVALGIANLQTIDQQRRTARNNNKSRSSMALSDRGAKTQVSRDKREAGIQAQGDHQRHSATGKLNRRSSLLECLTPKERGRDFWVSEVHSLDDPPTVSNRSSYERLLAENDRLLEENERLRNDKVRLAAEKLSAQEYINYLQEKLSENVIETMQMKRGLTKIRQKLEASKRQASDTPSRHSSKAQL
ncbi:protein swallow-like [Drosophila guanche]|uniref:Blast:Protein swallow n=1 Tax=Drosophila guanche TaxID=7266 RepID=A0A3B0KB02_DROGU|nr:protein swallow-like [Drosophila guanche]SPP82231.1 blast:Protein swallow [Drosophila guanche]